MVFSTQQAIDIAGVKDGIMIMKDGSYRLVLQVAAINFSLKSEQEQNSLIFQYQSFLNSLHFPVQIVIRSRRLDLAPYLKKLEDKTKTQTNELIRMQTEDYIGFISQLIGMANIMKKTFYAVVSFNPISVRQVGIFDRFFSKGQVFDHIKISDADFQAHTGKLRERANTLASGLGSMGLHCFQLTTEQVIETFYQIYNPDEAAKERVTDANAISSAIIISKDEMKAEEGAESVETQKSEEMMIDNSQIVIAQHKQEALQRKQEDEKAAEKEIRSPADTGQTAASSEGPYSAKATQGEQVARDKEEAQSATGTPTQPVETSSSQTAAAPQSDTADQPAPPQAKA